MRLLILTTIFFNMSVFAMDSYLVYKDNEIEKLTERTKKEPIKVYKRWGRYYTLSYKDLGIRITPYHQKENLTFTYYKNFSDVCYKLTFHEDVVAKVVSCNKAKPSLKVKGYENFRLIEKDEFTQLDYLNKKFEINRLEYSFQGYSFFYFMKDLQLYGDDRDPQLDDFKFSFTEYAEVEFHKYGLDLKKSVIFNNDKFHFFSPKQITKESTLDLRKNDYVFTNDSGEFLIFNRYLSGSANYNYLTLKDNYLSYLDEVTNNLFEYLGNKVCFTDYHLNHTNYDCEYMALQKKQFTTFKSFELLHINLNTSEITKI